MERPVQKYVQHVSNALGMAPSPLLLQPARGQRGGCRAVSKRQAPRGTALSLSGIQGKGGSSGRASAHTPTL
eukprot:scaffold140054_cov33-Tisochrysis_lutea.AAC.4